MARSSEFDNPAIYEIAQAWKSDCLIGGKSLLWPETDVWSKDTLSAFKSCFIDRPDESQDSFENKFQRQLKDAPENVTRLACELILIYFLFPSRITPRRKRELISQIASWKSLEVAVDDLKCLESGIGGTGQFYNNNRPFEIAFLARVALRLMEATSAEREAVLADHFRLREMLDEVQGDDTIVVRHIVLHLLFPDKYERICSGGDKRAIADGFADVLGETDVPEDLDDKLLSIRKRLESMIPDKRLDFYRAPLRECWYDSGESEDLRPAEGLAIKHQIVFYGPPGTGKTHEAKAVAASFIRRSMLRTLGPKRYFEETENVERTVTARVARVQFHPGYAYEDLIRGLQLGDNGKTEYKDGVLLRLIEQLGKEDTAHRLLPFVLIMDEMNRADLSKVLGECFSLLEDRDAEVELAGQHPRRLRLPANLCVIGTMNLIDQSLEQVDFALRRRFLWFFRGYSRDAFLRIARSRWEQNDGEEPRRSLGRNADWERVEEEFEILAARAEMLNRQIDTHPSLGKQYQIGHTYFCDVVPFAKRQLYQQPSAHRVLFNKKGHARPSITALWKYSLRPLLEQYLSGVDESARESFLEQACTVITSGTTE